MSLPEVQIDPSYQFIHPYESTTLFEQEVVLGHLITRPAKIFEAVESRGTDLPYLLVGTFLSEEAARWVLGCRAAARRMAGRGN